MDQPKKCADNAGECLRQTGYGYYNDNGCNCTVVPCPNHFLCGNSHPKWFLGCHGGRCLNCNMHFGSPNLTLVPTPSECLVCTEISIHVQIPGCSHKLCIDCFHRIYYSDCDDELNGAKDKCPMCRNELMPYWAKPKSKP